jgi:hypothetical protein
MPAEHEGARTPQPRRRMVVKAGAALAVGLTLGSGYVRPSVTSVELVEVAYASGNPLAAPRGGGQGGPAPGGKGRGKGN